MTVEVTVKAVEPTPTAVVTAAATWPEFPKMWGPRLDKVWSFLRGGAPDGLYQHGHNIMLYKDDLPNVEVGVQKGVPAGRPSLGDLRRSRPVDRRIRCGGVVVAGGAVTPGKTRP